MAASIAAVAAESAVARKAVFHQCKLSHNLQFFKSKLFVDFSSFRYFYRVTIKVKPNHINVFFGRKIIITSNED